MAHWQSVGCTTVLSFRTLFWKYPAYYLPHYACDLPHKVYDQADGWAWVQLERDRYVGYIPAEGLATEVTTPTHRVQTISTHIYPRPDIKTSPIMPLSCGSLLAVKSGDDKFCELMTGGFVPARHVAELGRPARDFVEVAERFLGVPYLWGGRTRLGIDCSGLVQVALDAAAIPCPRDTDMQVAEVGTSILVPNDLEGLQRGDLVARGDLDRLELFAPRPQVEHSVPPTSPGGAAKRNPPASLMASTCLRSRANGRGTPRSSCRRRR
jgi:cell wall-associated NlpC family hydrolase